MITIMEGTSTGGRPLSELQPGQQGKILALNVAGANKIRLLEMGLTVGTTIECVRFAHLGDPIEFKVRGANISLRKADVTDILVAMQ